MRALRPCSRPTSRLGSWLLTAVSGGLGASCCVNMQPCWLFVCLFLLTRVISSAKSLRDPEQESFSTGGPFLSHIHIHTHTHTHTRPRPWLYWPGCRHTVCTWQGITEPRPKPHTVGSGRCLPRHSTPAAVLSKQALACSEVLANACGSG